MALERKSTRIIADPGAQVDLDNRPDRYLRVGLVFISKQGVGRNLAYRLNIILGFDLAMVCSYRIRLLANTCPQDIVAKIRSQNRNIKWRKGAGHPAIIIRSLYQAPEMKRADADHSDIDT